MPDNSHSSREHALLSASGASRWLACNQSAVLIDEYPDEDDGIYADEGTLAHELAELTLRSELEKVDPYELAILETSELYSPEMPIEIAKYTEYVLQQYNLAQKSDPETFILLEDKVYLQEYIEEGFGICDNIILGNRVLEVTDLKYGEGILVFAKDNPQLKLYALGALLKYYIIYDIDIVRLNIIQPRRDNISVYEMSPDDLFLWGASEVKPMAKKAYVGQGSFIAGEHCRDMWCPVAHRCPKLAERMAEISAYEMKSPELLSDDELISIYTSGELVVSWYNRVKKKVLEEALNGKKWPDHKLVAGRSARTWKDEARAREKLGEHYDGLTIFNTKLKGLGDLEKSIGKDDFKKHCAPLLHKLAGSPKLVHESDTRPAMGTTEELKQIFSIE